MIFEQFLCAWQIPLWEMGQKWAKVDKISPNAPKSGFMQLCQSLNFLDSNGFSQIVESDMAVWLLTSLGVKNVFMVENTALVVVVTALAVVVVVTALIVVVVGQNSDFV